MKTICIGFLVGAALLVGCTNNEYPASRSPLRLYQPLPQPSAKYHPEPWFQKAMERSAREAEIKADLEASGYKVEYGGGLY